MNMLQVFLNTLFTPLTDKLKELLKKKADKKKLKTFQSTLRKASYAGSPFLKYYLNQKINTCMMFFLQSISFFTTLAGANYYLRGINGMAPLLFAVTIQMGLFYYASTLHNADRKRPAHFLMLTLFTLISIVFSYTGMAILTVPPLQEYENSYRNYEEKAEAVTALVLSANSSQTDIDLALQQFIVSIDQALVNADTSIQSLEAAISANNDIISQSWETSRTYSENPDTGETSISTTTTLNPAGVQATDENADMSAQKTSLKAARDQLETTRAGLDTSALQAYVYDQLDEADSNAIVAEIYTIIHQYNALCQLLSKDTLDEGYIDDLRVKYAAGSVISQITLTPLEDITVSSSAASDALTLTSLIQALTKQESSASEMQKTLQKLQNAADTHYRELEKQVLILNMDPVVLNELQTARQELNAYGDPNMQSILYLLDAVYRNRVLGVLVLAILVDGLTFFLGIINGQKRLNLLKPSTNKELNNEDQLFSIIFVSLISMELPKELQNIADKAFEAACTQYVNHIKDIIREFLKVFKNSPWTSQWGYGLYVEYDVLQKVTGSVPLISILHQLGYLQFLSVEDFQLLKDSFNGVDISDPNYSASPVSGKPKEDRSESYICVLRYRVEMYLHDNTAKISTMFLDEKLKEVKTT